MSVAVKWPNGKEHAKLRNIINRNRHVIHNGRVLAIDPASGKSSAPGYAFWEKGQLLEFGDINVDPRLPVQNRLAEICDCLSKEFPGVDVLAIEQIRGRMASHVLHWSVGGIITTVRPPLLLEIPLWTWKAVAKATPHYKKQDDLDSVMIGGSVMLLAGVEGELL